jgi:uncharacterized protein (TIGR02145 family)
MADLPSGLGTATTRPNTVFYLGQLDSSDPSQQALNDFGAMKAQELYGSSTLLTGYTIRDQKDRDWRYIEDGEVIEPPIPPIDNRMYDPKDGQYYDVIQSGGLFWTTRNYSYNGNGVFYNNSEPFTNAGKLYSYAEADANKPNGWRLPTEQEVRDLITAHGGLFALKGTTTWQTANGTNTSGFNLLAAGYNNGSFSYIEQRSSIWLNDATNHRWFVMYNTANSGTGNFQADNYLCSIRYVKAVS